MASTLYPFRLRLLILLAVYALMLSPMQAQQYFQQEVNYKINVRLDDREHFLHAFESFEYINNSPDTLKKLYIHLWPNAYKNDHTALARQLINSNNTKFYESSQKDRG